MKSHADVAHALRDSLQRRSISQQQLRGEAGISQRTLTNVLSGHEDFKVSTLFALADRLGLELLLVPKEASRAFSSPESSAPEIKTKVGALILRTQELK